MTSREHTVKKQFQRESVFLAAQQEANNFACVEKECIYSEDYTLSPKKIIVEVNCL